MNSLFHKLPINERRLLTTHALIICILFSQLLLNNAICQESISDTQKRLDTITNSVQRIENKIAKNVKNHELVHKEMAKLDQEIGHLHQQIAQSESKILLSKKRFNSLQDEKSRLSEDLEKQSDLFRGQVKMAYLSSNQSKWKLLLSQSSLQHAGKYATMYDYIHQARLNEMQRINELSDQIKQNQTHLTEQQTKLEVLLQQLDQEQSVLTQARVQKQQIKNSLQQSITDDQQALKIEQKQQLRLRKLLSKLKAEQPENAAGKFASLTGKLDWPVEGRIRFKYGDKTSGTEWNGVSILANRGSEIYAVYAGEVIFADWFDHYGWLLIVDHGDGYMSLYAHAEGLYKNTGDYVTQGELIAVVGDSGEVQQTSLYFEIRRQGTPVDPAAWCVNPKLPYSS